MKATGLFFLTLGISSTLPLALAQIPNPTVQPPRRALTPADTGQPMPIFRVTVVSRTTPAINYHHRTGSTHVDFRGTDLGGVSRRLSDYLGKVVVLFVLGNT